MTTETTPLIPMTSISTLDELKAIKIHTTISSMKRAGACAKEIKVVKGGKDIPTLTYILKNDKWTANILSGDMIKWNVARSLGLFD
jgi:hypothetical protein